jgi:tetratricopeptide (TPR) repeat protein
VHELLRQYGESKLNERRPEQRRVHDLHCAYYAEFVQRREADAIAGRQQAILSEMDNVRGAWRWAVQQGQASAILKFYYSLHFVYLVQCWREEGQVLFAQAAVALRTGEPVGQSGIVLGLVLGSQSRFTQESDARKLQLARKGRAILQSLDAREALAWANTHFAAPDTVDHSEAEHLFQESLAIYTELDIPWGIAVALDRLSWFSQFRRAYEEAERYARRALKINRDLGNTRGTGLSLRHLGEAAYGQQAYAKARQFHQASLVIFQEIGDRFHIAWALGDLARVAMAEGQLDQARTQLEDSLAVSRATSDPNTTAWHLALLGHVTSAMNDGRGARKHYRRALQIALDEHYSGVSLDVLDGWAMLLAREGDREKALELLTLTLRYPKGGGTWWTEMAEREKKLLAELRVQLSHDVFAAAQERGRARDLDATMRELLTEH